MLGFCWEEQHLTGLIQERASTLSLDSLLQEDLCPRPCCCHYTTGIHSQNCSGRGLPITLRNPQAIQSTPCPYLLPTSTSVWSSQEANSSVSSPGGGPPFPMLWVQGDKALAMLALFYPHLVRGYLLCKSTTQIKVKKLLCHIQKISL